MNFTGGCASAILLSILSLGVWLQCFTESEFILNPLIDTQLPPGFTLTKFESIKPGMTKAQVLKIIPPPEYLSNNDSWGYGNDGAAPFGDFAWFRFTVHFDAQGKVTKTERLKFHD
jgi:hypothetical protein